MQTLEELRATIRTTQELQSVVRTMKALAMAGTRQYQLARESLVAYTASVELALQAVLRLQRFDATPSSLSSLLPSSTSPGDVGVILYGSSHGLCGPFNEQIVTFTSEELRRRGIAHERCRMAVVGDRLATLLEGGPLPVEARFSLPSSVAVISVLLQELLPLIEGWRFPDSVAGAMKSDPAGSDPEHTSAGVGRILLVYQRDLTATTHQPSALQLLPLDPSWLGGLQWRAWGSCGEPMNNQPLPGLFAGIVQEYLHLCLFRAAVESLASENAARLTAMHAAGEHIDERLSELNALHRQQRQNAITGELLDIVSGFEALRQRE